MVKNRIGSRRYWRICRGSRTGYYRGDIGEYVEDQEQDRIKEILENM